jgi:hypothetical protein
MAAKKAKRVPADQRQLLAQREVKAADLAVRRNSQTILELQAKQQKLLETVRARQHQVAELAIRSLSREGRPTLSCLAQGDSWFSYPCGHALISDLDNHLYKGKHGAIENLGVAGRQLQEMMNGRLLQELLEHLKNPPGDRPWDTVLLSGGGNDICGNGVFARWISDYRSGETDPAACITPAFDAELTYLAQLVTQFVDLVEQTSPKALVFLNCYDYALPTGTCVKVLNFCAAGPWIRPAFVQRKYYSRGHARPVTVSGEDLPTAIVRTMLQRYKSTLDSIAQQHRCVRVVATQGTLGQVKSHWANELHPTDPWFKALAAVFYKAIAAEFPAFAAM